MAEVMIRVICPNLQCKRILAVPMSARGKSVRCKNCGTTVRIPAAQKKVENKEQEGEKSEDSSAEKVEQ